MQINTQIELEYYKQHNKRTILTCQGKEGRKVY